MLILTAVVACAANGYGIRYRRSRPMREALDRLERFQPEATYLGGTMVELDFSPCVTKPRDDDLANVESLDGLVTLNLDGAPVTDAGLTHLTGLKNLRVLVLTGTKVSDDGVRRVKKAIPRLGIFR